MLGAGVHVQDLAICCIILFIDAAADLRSRSQTLNFVDFYSICIKILCLKLAFIMKWHWSGVYMSPCSLAELSSFFCLRLMVLNGDITSAWGKTIIVGKNCLQLCCHSVDGQQKPNQVT